MTVGELRAILIDVPHDIDVVVSDDCVDKYDVTQVIRVRGLFGTSDDNLVISAD